MRLKLFTWWESATHAPASARPGLVPPQLAWPLTAASALVFAIILWPVLGYASLPVAVVFGRLLALDAATYTLPNVYTIPMLCIGLLQATHGGRLTEVLLAIAAIFVTGAILSRMGGRFGIGGGDAKLLAAMCALMPLDATCFAVAIGCLFYLPIAFTNPKASVPFGIPLILGWVILLRLPDLPNWLIFAIS